VNAERSRTPAGARKQAHVEGAYRFIVEFSEKHLGHFPSHRVIGAAIGVKSPSMIHSYVAALAADGRVVYIDGLPCVAGARWIAPGRTPFGSLWEPAIDGTDA